MSYKNLHKHSIEVLEARIAPAVLPGLAGAYKPALFGVNELHAGEVLTTGTQTGGTYLMYLEKGNALVYITDLNSNGVVDSNEVTGIAAGNGMRLVSFADIHGDIVTNLKEIGTGANLVLSLSDSGDATSGGHDGRVLLNNTIEKIELRSLRVSDIAVDMNGGGIDSTDVALRAPATTFSIYGNIYAGRGFGAVDGGLRIDTGVATLAVHPQIGFIKTGTAVSGEFYTFGATRSLSDRNGTMSKFTPPSGQVGGDITGVLATDFSVTPPSAVSTVAFNIDGLVSGKGGAGARGGNISNISLNADDTGGYRIVAGDGGRGTTGGVGGSIINFADVGSFTSEVVIRSGTGGQGLSGVGGDAGTLTFGTFNVLGVVGITGGDGGNGFSNGGNGASIGSGNFGGAVSVAVDPTGGVGTYHKSSGVSGGIIGTHDAIDFNNDAQGDFVYTTNGTSQLVVLLGGGERVYLSGVHNPGAVTVADLNGDGHLDIAVASGDTISNAGVVVFLAQYEHEGPGALLPSEDLNGDGVNNFVGFHDSRFSPVPMIDAGASVTNMVAGDFTGSGHTELAIVLKNQSLMFLSADLETDHGLVVATGQFFADYGVLGGIQLHPVLGVGNAAGDKVLIESTALRTAANHDVVISGLIGTVDNAAVINSADIKGGIHAIGYYNPINGSSPGAPGGTGIWEMGVVDTNRALLVPATANSAQVDNFTLDDFHLKGFTVTDFNNDGLMDLGVVSNNGYFVGIKGDGLGAGVQDSGGNRSSAVNNAGTFFGAVDVVQGAIGFNLVNSLLAVRSADLNNDGIFSDFVVHHAASGATPSTSNTAVAYNSGAQVSLLTGATKISTSGAVGNVDQLTGEVAFFDLSYSDTTTHASPQYAYPYTDLGERVIGRLITTVGFSLSAGNGGSGLLGAGGIGGSLGGVPKLITSTDSAGVVTKSLIGALNITGGFGALDFTAGNGGNGFTSGGAGGKITGVTTNGSVTVTAGSGGRGFTQSGGAGGDISANAFESGSDSYTVYTAGDGGSGITGGKGGSVLGNQSTDFIDAKLSFASIVAGDGGAGVKIGGAGGSIVNFHTEVNTSKFTDSFSLIAGDGGSAVSGAGGAGGSIVNSEPRPNAASTGGLYVTAGAGGSGLSGGSGGSITSFNYSSASGKAPSNIVGLAGNGGAGSVGSGGAGGSITGFIAKSSGLDGALNKLLAGNGGSSSAARGGAGGALIGDSLTVSQGTLALVAGAGGAGLIAGGAGGSVTNAIANPAGGSDTNKALVVAGAGGNASGYIANSSDMVPRPAQYARDLRNSFGGVAGQGGAGGSINGLTQQTIQDTHLDLISGDGGSTLNYGKRNDIKSYAGNGGSISNVKVVGSIGNVKSTVAIVSYNDLSVGETVADYVKVNLRGSSSQLSDATGNVGIVVGIAGRNRAVIADPIGAPTLYVSQLSDVALNGSLSNVDAKSIMSAVAGNVALIAAIQSAQNITVDAGGFVGTDKGAVGLNYLDTDGVTPVSTLNLGGGLVDGAFIARSFPGIVVGNPRQFVVV